MGPFDPEHSGDQAAETPDTENSSPQNLTAETAPPETLSPEAPPALPLTGQDEPADEPSEEEAAEVQTPVVVSPFSHHPVAADPVTPVAPPAPVATGAAFGLLFQAPDPASLPPRQERVRVDADESAADDQGGHDDAGATAQQTSAQDGEEAQESGTPRRRRGGRGRRARGGEAQDADADTRNAEGSKNAENGRNAKGDQNPSDGSNDSGSADDADGNSAKDVAEGDDAQGDDSGDGGQSRRRTRRRRRGNTAGVDEDGVKVRAGRDEVTAIKGSTRLEAKKQRRREGREASRRRTVITEAEFLARRESVERIMVVREKGDLIQMGVIEDGVLVEHYVSRETQQSTMAGNVYLGRIQNVLPSMEAAFVDIGRGRNGVLYAGEVNWDAAGLDGQPKRIEHALKSGETVMVQVTKDPLGHKGARLTSQVSLPGRFLVYVPGNSMTGISRKLPDTERARLKKILREIVPEDAGVIVRTAAEGASEEDLRADVERLKAEWERIEAKAKTASAPALLHGEPDLMIRVVRDVFNEDFSKLIVAGDTAWGEVSEYLQAVAPELGQRAEKWTGEVDLFSTFRVDEQLAKALDRKVWLPSGGSLVIDRTEAMTVVDVNTGKFVGSGGNLEETVTKNNIEAAEEIVRQLRLRDIGGIIVVDFIDMVLESNRDLVVRRLLECLGRDRTKHQVAEVTSLGLVQMTRKRVGTGLLEIFSEQCEHCAGRGIIVRDTPADKPNTANGGGMSGGNPSRNQRKGRGTDAGKKSKPEPEATKPSGPSAAQIAAAAHAAAAKKTGDQLAGSDEPVVVIVGDEASSIAEIVAADPVVVVPEADAPEVEVREVTIVEEPVVAVPEPAKPVTRRKKRPRVVAPAGPPTGAPAITTVDDLAAPATHQ